mmetsp:Transcript_8914/g.18521  ORF Transcript_8914/g.18521 Transcript_8914/m.18521 type:complete len:554 (+) Transcript_8914:136-1797(+)
MSTTDTMEIIQQKQRMPKAHVSSFELYLKPEELTPQRCQRIIKYARKRLRGQDNNSVHAYDNSSTQVRIPVVNHSQIQLGQQLGKGAFSSVYAIKSIKKKNKKSDDESSHESCDNMVVKFLRTKLYDNHGLFAASAADLVKEGNILATLSHSNVIRIHAVSSKYGVGAYLNGYHDSYFLVLERLEGTLSDHIQDWRIRHKELYEVDEVEGRYDPETALVTMSKPSSVRNWKEKFSTLKRSKSTDDLDLEISDRTNTTQALSDAGSEFGDDESTQTLVEKTQLLAERLDVAQQLADAISYLHSQNVIHRDLKPDNIGFDVHGDLKVFDFDIARVCPESEPTNRANGKNDETFLMTQKVGSPRYMSPEVAKREPYNLKADVYSYAVLAHQIITLQKPYDDISDEDHDELVFHKGVRPFLPAAMPSHTKELLSKAWSANISERPNMETIRQMMALERSEVLRVGTIGSLASMAVSQNNAYVWSCSFKAISDNNKKVKKMKMKPTPIVRKESFKINKSNKLLSIFKKNVGKPVKKGLLKENPLGRSSAEQGMTWMRR